MSDKVLYDANDGRTRYTHQAYFVSYGGKAKETSELGAQKRLSGTTAMYFQATVSAAADASFELELPPYALITHWMIPIPSTGGTLPTIDITVTDMDDANSAIVVAGADPSAQTAPTAATALSAVSNASRKVTIDVDSNSATGDVTILLQAAIIETQWK